MAARKTHVQISEETRRTAEVAGGIFDAVLDIIVNEASRAGIQQIAVHRELWLMFTGSLALSGWSAMELAHDAADRAIRTMNDGAMK